MTAFVVKNGATLTNTGDIHLSNGTAIEVVGAGSTVAADVSGKRGAITVDDGVAGIYVHGGATLTTADTITVDKGASGVLVGADAGKVVIAQGAHITGKGSSYGNLVTNQSVAGNVLVDGATLEMQGSGAALLSENNLDAASHGHVIVSSQVGGKGIALSKADGTTTAGSLALGPDWQIDVTGNGAGVYANTSGDVTLDGTRIAVSGPGNALKSDAANTVTVAAGTQVTGTNAAAKLVVGDMATLHNEGTIQSLDASAVAVELGAANTAFENVGTGAITGSVDLGAGDDSALLADSSVLDGELRGGAGSDTVTVRGNSVRHGVLDGGLGATDTLVFDGHDYTADGSNVDQLRNFEAVNLTHASTLNLSRDFALGDNGNGAGTLGIDGSSTLVSFGKQAVRGSVANAGAITLGNGTAGDTLTVTGDYASNGGTVELDTVLGDDAAATDKLVVNGSTSGSTNLKVNGVADTGAYTSADGIQLVQVDGTSAGTFALSGRVVAGAREYLLAQGGKANPADGDWYLRSEAPVPPGCEVTHSCPPVDPPVVVVDPPVVVDPQPTDVTPPVNVPVYRPEIGAYLGNQTAALGLFQHTLHDRLGEVDFDQRQRNGDDRRGAVWTRVVRNQFDATTGAGQIALGTDSSLLQVGGELGRWSDGDRRWQVGGMGAFGQADTHVGSDVTGYQAKGKVKAQLLGVYGTWYANASKPTGLYVDSWVQGGRFDNRVEGDTLARESYDAKGWAASLEAGYAFELGRGERSALYIEPQAQVIVSDYRADDHREANGTRVKTEQGGGVTTRLGARAYTRPLTDAHNRVQPFVEANWWHRGDTQAIALNDEVQGLDLSKDVYEVKVGAQAELGHGWTGWGHLGLQTAAGDEHSVEGQLGVKYGW